MNEFVVAGQPPRRQDVYVSTGDPVGYAQDTAVSTTAKSLPSIPSNANKALIIFENASVRWRDDGTSPTGSVGMLLYVGQVLTLESRTSLTNFKVIREANETVDASLNVSYYQK